jgi:magnesium transporter
VLLELAEAFELHRLALEDVVNGGQRPKAEAYGDTLFVVMRSPGTELGTSEQVSLFKGPDWVVTFHEGSAACLEPVRERIRAGNGRLTGNGTDYLLYAVLDAVIDAYFPVLEAVHERLEELEQEVLHEPQAGSLERLHAVRRELADVRRTLWPHRDALTALQREPDSMIAPDTQLFLRDAQDHALRLVEMADGLRETAAELMNTYLTMVSNRMNEVMKVLTIIATIFIPLSFIAGLYGMNFDYMPELHWKGGYFMALGLMGAVGGLLVGYFWRRGWFR